MNVSLPLRQYQYDNVLQLIELIEQGERRIVDQLPTRAGKTRIASLVGQARAFHHPAVEPYRTDKPCF